MASLQRLGNGAGSGDRTRITSLEGVRSRVFPPVFAMLDPAQSRNKAGCDAEHREALPHFCRNIKQPGAMLPAPAGPDQSEGAFAVGEHIFVIEVQHTTDFQLDGVWHELERASTLEQAERLLRYFGIEKPIPKGIRPEECTLSGGYAGRPLRYRQIGGAA